MYVYTCLCRFLRLIKIKQTFNNSVLKLISIRKNLFFKKKYAPKILASKRLSIVLRKRKRFKNFKTKKIDKGNFFFKKFFFKTLLRSRKYLRRFFFFNNKVRQTKITNYISKNVKSLLKNNHNNYELTLFNVLLRSHFCLFISDVLLLIKNKFVYVNGIVLEQHDAILSVHDCVQLMVCRYTYTYIKRSKKMLKKKIALFKLNSWKFFKQKLFKQKQNLKAKKRKTPKYLFLFFLFKLNVPRFLEIDYLTLTILILKPYNNQFITTYYLNKLFSYKLFSLYNFKKLN